MTKLQKQRLEFLEESIAYYSADTRRRAVVGDSCQYRTSNRKNCRKCMIGRHIPENKYRVLMEGQSVSSSVVLNSLPLEVSQLGETFLDDLQHFHDLSSNWNKRSGLTASGKDRIKYIKQRFLNGEN